MGRKPRLPPPPTEPTPAELRRTIFESGDLFGLLEAMNNAPPGDMRPAVEFEWLDKLVSQRATSDPLQLAKDLQGRTCGLLASAVLRSQIGIQKRLGAHDTSQQGRGGPLPEDVEPALTRLVKLQEQLAKVAVVTARAAKLQEETRALRITNDAGELRQLTAQPPDHPVPAESALPADSSQAGLPRSNAVLGIPTIGSTSNTPEDESLAAVDSAGAVIPERLTEMANGAMAATTDISDAVEATGNTNDATDLWQPHSVLGDAMAASTGAELAINMPGTTEPPACNR